MRTIDNRFWCLIILGHILFLRIDAACKNERKSHVLGMHKIIRWRMWWKAGVLWNSCSDRSDGWFAGVWRNEEISLNIRPARHTLSKTISMPRITAAVCCVEWLCRPERWSIEEWYTVLWSKPELFGTNFGKSVNVESSENEAFVNFWKLRCDRPVIS